MWCELHVEDTFSYAVSLQGASYTTDGMRDTRQSMTCNLPWQILQLYNRHLDFESIRPNDSDFSKLPPGGAVQTYTVSASNNGRVFGSSQTYTLLFNSTCISCEVSGLIQEVGVLFFRYSYCDCNYDCSTCLQLWLGHPSSPLVHLLPHLFPVFTFPFLSLALPIFFFCPSLPFLPE